MLHSDTPNAFSMDDSTAKFHCNYPNPGERALQGASIAQPDSGPSRGQGGLAWPASTAQLWCKCPHQMPPSPGGWVVIKSQPKNTSLPNTETQRLTHSAFPAQDGAPPQPPKESPACPRPDSGAREGLAVFPQLSGSETCFGTMAQDSLLPETTTRPCLPWGMSAANQEGWSLTLDGKWWEEDKSTTNLTECSRKMVPKGWPSTGRAWGVLKAR